MAVSLLQLETIAAIPRMTMPAIKMVIAMSIIQSDPSAIERAATAHKWLFTGYILLLLFTALMTWLVWQSGNKLQDAIRNDAEAKIESAKAEAANATKQAEELKNENLKLGIKLEEERKARLEIERRVGPRFISPKEREIIISNLRPYPDQPIVVYEPGQDIEAKSYAEQIIGALKEAKWNVTVNIGYFRTPPLYGIFCPVSKQPSRSVQAFVSTFQNLGINLTIESTDTPADYVHLEIGLKHP